VREGGGEGRWGVNQQFSEQDGPSGEVRRVLSTAQPCPTSSHNPVTLPIPRPSRASLNPSPITLDSNQRAFLSADQCGAPALAPCPIPIRNPITRHAPARAVCFYQGATRLPLPEFCPICLHQSATQSGSELNQGEAST